MILQFQKNSTNIRANFGEKKEFPVFFSFFRFFGAQPLLLIGKHNKGSAHCPALNVNRKEGKAHCPELNVDSNFKKGAKPRVVGRFIMLIFNILRQVHL
jgi:hypothetical protein